MFEWPRNPVLIDISPPVRSSIAVFPGDIPYQRTPSMSFAAGDHLALSSIQSTLHLGAHADAPSHFSASGYGIDQANLHHYLGPAQVIRVAIRSGARIMPSDLATTRISEKRILFRTDSFPDPDQWQHDFNSLSPELILFLHERGVITIGIDTPSVDPADSKELESHQALLQTGIANLEGLNLSEAECGSYLLIALPLRLEGADASPVRAVLVQSC